MEWNRSRPPSASLFIPAIIAVLLLLFFLALSVTPIRNNDVWLHIASGRWIVEHGEVPKVDPYSFSAEGNRFYAHEWLAGVIFYGVHRAAGPAGLILLKTFLCGAAFLFAAAAALRAGSRAGPTIAFTALGLAAANYRFLERPEIFSLFLTGVYLLVLVEEHRRFAGEGTHGFLRSSLLWALVPLQWFWAQTHGYFLTGLALAGLFLAGEALERVWARGGNEGKDRARRRILSGFAAWVAMILIGLANPNGVEAYIFPFLLVGKENVFTQTVHEWRPTFRSAHILGSSMFLAFLLSIALLAVASLRCFRRPAAAWRHWGLVAVLALLVAGTRTLLSHPPDGTEEVFLGSAWLWSPGEWLARASTDPDLLRRLDLLFSPFRVLGPAGDDIFTFVLIGLLAATWAGRRNRPFVLSVWVAAVLFFSFLVLGSAALGPVLLVSVVSLLLLAFRQKAPVWMLLVVAFFLYLAVRQNRNMASFALVFLPLASLLFSTFEPRTPSSDRRLGIFLTILLAVSLALTVTVGWPLAPDAWKRPGVGVGDPVPVAAVDYAEERGIEGRVFNRYTYGAYIIHRLFPETRVFIDSRNLVYGRDLYEEYRKARRLALAASDLFDRYHFDYVLFDYSFFPHPQASPGVITHLAADPHWLLVYFDDQSLLYLPATPANRDIIEADGFRIVNPALYSPAALFKMGEQELALFGEETARAVQRFPECVAAKVMRADYLAVSGRAGEAIDLLEGTILAGEANTFAFVMAASLHWQTGNAARADYLRQKARLLEPALRWEGAK